MWSILDEKPHHYSLTTNVPQADLAHHGFWPLNWVTERKQREETRAEVKRDTGRVPLGLDAILHGPGVTFPLIQSQEVHISPAGFDHSSVDSSSADTGALDMKRQKRILLVGMLSCAILSQRGFISSSVDWYHASSKHTLARVIYYIHCRSKFGIFGVFDVFERPTMRVLKSAQITGFHREYVPILHNATSVKCQHKLPKSSDCSDFFATGVNTSVNQSKQTGPELQVRATVIVMLAIALCSYVFHSQFHSPWDVNSLKEPRQMTSLRGLQYTHQQGQSSRAPEKASWPDAWQLQCVYELSGTSCTYSFYSFNLERRFNSVCFCPLNTSVWP